MLVLNSRLYLSRLWNWVAKKRPKFWVPRLATGSRFPMPADYLFSFPSAFHRNAALSRKKEPWVKSVEEFSTWEGLLFGIAHPENGKNGQPSRNGPFYMPGCGATIHRVRYAERLGASGLLVGAEPTQTHNFQGSGRRTRWKNNLFLANS